MFERLNLLRGLALGLIVAACYFIPNNFVLLQPHGVPVTPIDRWVQLSPVWVWAYVSYYPLLVWAYFLATGHLAQKIYVESMLLAAAIGLFIFWFFPTEISRDLYPWSGDLTWSVRLLEYVRSADNSVNCLPSMHVGMSFLAAATITSVTAWRGRLLVWLLFFAICYSTMATKQHYFVDLVAGLSLGGVVYALTLKRHGQLASSALPQAAQRIF